MTPTLNIKVNGSYLELPPEFALGIDLINPLTAEGVNISLFNYPATIPNSPANARAFGYPGTVELAATVNVFESHTAELELDGTLILRGNITISQATEKEISIYFRDQLGTLKDNIENKTLRDLEFEEINLLDYSADIVEAADLIANGTDDNRPLCFPPFYIELHDTFSAIVANDFDPINNTHEGQGETTFIPCSYVKHVLAQIFTDEGFSVTSDFFTDAQWKRLFIHNTRSLMHGGTGNPPANYPIRYIFPDLIEMQVHPEKHLPQLKLVAFLSELKRLFNLAIDFNRLLPQAEMISWKEIESADEREDWTALAAPEPLVEEPEYNGVVRSHKEDDGNELVTDKVLDVSTLTQLAAVNTVADLPTVVGNEGKVCLVKGIDQWYIVQESEWIFYSFNIQPATDGNREDEIENEMCQLPMTEHATPNSPWAAYKYKMAQLAFSYEEMPQVLKGDFNLRLMFYYGFKLEKTGTYYVPLAAVDENNQAGGNIGDWCLHWSGDRGLFTTFWESFYRMIAFKPVTYPVRMDLKTLLNFSYKKFITIRGQKLFIKRIRLQLPRLDKTVVEFYKVPEA